MWLLLAGMKQEWEIKVEIGKRKNQSNNLANLLLNLFSEDQKHHFQRTARVVKYHSRVDFDLELLYTTHNVSTVE
jgi:hypothetical protein